jgi:hypothetical protein
MARLTTRIIVRAFGGGEVVDLLQAPEPKTLKLSGYLDAYEGYFGEPVAQLRSPAEGDDQHVGWVFAVPDDYDASELPGPKYFFELVVVPLVHDLEDFGQFAPALTQADLTGVNTSPSIDDCTADRWRPRAHLPVRLIDGDALERYLNTPVQ